jgi:hypothetical protein
VIDVVIELLRTWLVAGLLLTPILGGFCALPCP